MKSRAGFVSNSSTSSFVVLGYLLPEDKYSAEKVFDTIKAEEEEAIADIEARGLWLGAGAEDNVPGGLTLIGCKIADNEEGLAFTKTVTLASALAELDKQITGPLGLTGTDYPILLYFGQERC